jgi:hypothetical protein
MPRHLVVPPFKSDTHLNTVQERNTGAYLVSGIVSITGEAQDLQKESLLENQPLPQAEQNAIAPYVDPYGNVFDWSVTPAIDSAYGSGSAAQESDAAFSQDRAVTPGQYLLHRGDTEAAVQHTGGILDQAGTDYGDLHLDENE